MVIVPVIIAGGIGERFWPLSRSASPKQLLHLVSSKTMIEETLIRCSPLCSKTVKPLIITGKSIAHRMKKILPQHLKYDCIVEPEGKNTAPAVLLAAAWIENKYGPAIMIILSADHDIRPYSAFHTAVRTAIRFAQSNEALVIFGIKPTRVECGYGYLHVTDIVKSTKHAKVCKVEKFIEKPSRVKALHYLKNQTYLWNSGMFVWKTSVILQEFEMLLPDLAVHVKDTRQKGFSQKSIDRFYYKCYKISIDYGIMERSNRVFAVIGNFIWDDIGSWEAMSRIHGKNTAGVTTIGKNIIDFECKNSLFFNRAATTIAVIGLNDIAVINTDDALLVAHRSQLPDLKNYLTLIKKNEHLPKGLF